MSVLLSLVIVLVTMGISWGTLYQVAIDNQAQLKVANQTIKENQKATDALKTDIAVIKEVLKNAKLLSKNVEVSPLAYSLPIIPLTPSPELTVAPLVYSLTVKTDAGASAQPKQEPDKPMQKPVDKILQKLGL